LSCSTLLTSNSRTIPQHSLAYLYIVGGLAYIPVVASSREEYLVSIYTPIERMKNNTFHLHYYYLFERDQATQTLETREATPPGWEAHVSAEVDCFNYPPLCQGNNYTYTQQYSHV
jgi:hypothetical protein